MTDDGTPATETADDASTAGDVLREEPPAGGTPAERPPHAATDDHLRDHLQDRLRAVERALADGGDPAPAALPDAAETAAERDAIRDRMDEIERRVAELEAATQALRGYAAGVRSVNEEVERRADLALATARTARVTAERADGDDRPGTGRLGDDDRSSLLPDDPAVAAAVPDPSADTERSTGSADSTDADRSADSDRSAGSDHPSAEENDADGAAGRSWGDEAIARLRDAL
ncbi:hypothetical protein JCM17823_12300 [Halorubrum gandharaense]